MSTNVRKRPKKPRERGKKGKKDQKVRRKRPEGRGQAATSFRATSIGFAEAGESPMEWRQGYLRPGRFNPMLKKESMWSSQLTSTEASPSR